MQDIDEEEGWGQPDGMLGPTEEERMQQYEVQVQRTISTRVTVTAASADEAVAQVGRRDFQLPPRDAWEGHKDWEIEVIDAD